MTPEISVLMPARDAEATLPEALDSLTAQTFADFEIIAVNDGSSDGSETVLRDYAKRERRLKIISTPPRGITEALNTGLRACRGTLVARHDADDICAPERLERQRAFMQSRPGIAVASCQVRMFPRNQLRGGMRRYEKWINGLTRHEDIRREIFIESPLPHPSALLRRAELAAMGGYREMGWPEDYDLWLRYLERGARFGKAQETLLYWRDTPGRMSRTDPRYNKDNFARLKAHFLGRGKIHAARPVIIWGAGPTGARLARCLRREKVETKAFIDIDPKKTGRFRLGIPVLSPDVLKPKPRHKVLIAVGAMEARRRIRLHLSQLNLKEGRNYLCVS